MDIEWWKSFFEIGGVVLLFLTFAFGAGFMLTGKKVNEQQAERLRKFDTDLTGAKTELAAQQTRAATAEGNIALAEQHAAEANAKAEGFKADIAKAQEEAAKAQSQVAGATAESAKASAKAEEFRLGIAQANERAAQSQLETEKLKAVVTWRTLPASNADELEKALAANPGSINLRYTDGDPESLFLAIQFSRILEKAGWKIAPSSLKLDGALQWGIALPDSSGTEAQTLRSAFAAAKIAFSTEPVPPASMSVGRSIAGAPILMIGSRPPVMP